jgi:hypothetical protein
LASGVLSDGILRGSGGKRCGLLHAGAKGSSEFTERIGFVAKFVHPTLPKIIPTGGPVGMLVSTKPSPGASLARRSGPSVAQDPSKSPQTLRATNFCLLFLKRHLGEEAPLRSLWHQSPRRARWHLPPEPWCPITPIRVAAAAVAQRPVELGLVLPQATWPQEQEPELPA